MPETAGLRRPEKVMGTAAVRPRQLDPVSELLREAVACAARGSRTDADALLGAIRVLENDRLKREGGGDTDLSARPQAENLHSLLFARGLQAHRAEAYDKAERLYRALTVLAPSHAMVWSNLAAVLVHRGELDAAIAACRTALDLSPQHLNALINLAGALQKTGAFDEAVATFRCLLAYHPNRLDLRKAMGSLLEQAGRADEALAVYDAWIEIAPDAIDAFMAKAEALTTLERIDEAIGCYANVVALDPDHAIANSSMGILKAQPSASRDLDEAVSLCLRAAALAPDSLPILDNLGVALQARGDLDHALLVFEGMARIDPDYVSAHTHIGEILRLRGRCGEAAGQAVPDLTFG